MQTHDIDLKTLKPFGRAKIESDKSAVKIWTTHSITPQSFILNGDTFKRHYVSLPDKYCLPFRIDMTVSLDYPSLIILVGNGHITFASPLQDNRKIEDIIIPSGKPNQDFNSFDNSLPFNEETRISVTYNFDEMQIIINDEERFYSRNQAYMKKRNKSDVKRANEEGIPIKLAVSKRSNLLIKAITVTQSDENLPVKRGEFKEYIPPADKERPKFTFESIVASLPGDIADKVLKMDSFLKFLHPLKFKRMVDKSGTKISYVASDFGLSYAIYVSGAQSFHDFGWYIVYSGKPDTWHVKADYMEETLNTIAKTDPTLSERIFYALNDCIGCYGHVCLAKRLYAYDGNKRLACHGRVVLHISENDCNDIQVFFRHLCDIMEQKIRNGEPILNKIMMMKG